MSSIAANINPERTNRWLLIGALALAVIAGVLIFAALANLGGDDDKTATSVAGGDTPVLVANDTIRAGTKLTPDMFRSATFAEADVVPGAVKEAAAVDGLTARVEVLKGQQLSQSAISNASDDERTDQLAFKIPDGKRAIAVSVNEVTGVAGLLVPGDRVDIVVTIEEKRFVNDEQQFVRIQTVLQNIEVLARAQTDVEGVVVLDAEGNTVSPTDTGGAEFERRPTDIDPEANAGTVTLALSPEEVQRLVLADALGDITLSLRAYGENGVAPVEEILVPVYNR